MTIWLRNFMVTHLHWYTHSIAKIDHYKGNGSQPLLTRKIWSQHFRKFLSISFWASSWWNWNWTHETSIRVSAIWCLEWIEMGKLSIHWKKNICCYIYSFRIVSFRCTRFLLSYVFTFTRVIVTLSHFQVSTFQKQETYKIQC